jgi:hypothetical protein
MCAGLKKGVTRFISNGAITVIIVMAELSLEWSCYTNLSTTYKLPEITLKYLSFMSLLWCKTGKGKGEIKQVKVKLSLGLII